MNRYHYIDEQGNISDPLPLAALHKIGLPPSTHVLLEGAKNWTSLGQVSDQGAVILPAPPVRDSTVPTAGTIPMAAGTPAVQPAPNLTTGEKLLLDRVKARSATRDRMVQNQTARNLVCAIMVGWGLLTLIVTLAGGEAAVRESLVAQHAGEAGREFGAPASSDLAKQLAGEAMDITGLTKHEHVGRIGSAVFWVVLGVILWWGWKFAWEAWPFMRAKAWTGAFFFLAGLGTAVTNNGPGIIESGVLFMGLGFWLFHSGVTKTKAIIGHLTAVTNPT
jgi:hypothetical protein